MQGEGLKRKQASQDMRAIVRCELAVEKGQCPVFLCIATCARGPVLVPMRGIYIQCH